MGFAQLMYTVDDSDDEETTVVLLDARSRAAQLATAGLLHQKPDLIATMAAQPSARVVTSTTTTIVRMCRWSYYFTSGSE